MASPVGEAFRCLDLLSECKRHHFSSPVLRKCRVGGVLFLLGALCFSCSSPGPGSSCLHCSGGLLLSDERAVGPEEVDAGFRRTRGKTSR